MTRPELWAPAATTVQLEGPDGVVECSRSGTVWQAPTGLAPGARYRFVVDGTPVPDPRSRWQPDGVHAMSAVPPLPAPLDPAPGVARPVPSDLDRAVIYELHVGTFDPSGTLLGAVGHLDHLVELGVTHVELMPLAAFDGSVGWGYDGVCLDAPHPEYGRPDDVRHFVAECHRRGLAVLLDVVHNHLGPSGNYLGVTGPYFTDRYSTPWGDAVNLDGPGSDGVRSFLIDSALYWLDEIGFDGLRLDAVHALFDLSARPYLEELADSVRSLGRRTGREFVLIAESDLNDPRLASPSPCGPGLDAMWADDLHHCLHVGLTGEQQGYYEDYTLSDLPAALGGAYVYQGRHSVHRDRRIGRPTDGFRSSAFVGALQNHDQVGNRAAGDRIHHQVGEDRAAAAAALLLLSPFGVLMFQGEEWAASTPFPYFSDQPGELGEAIRTGRRQEFAAFGWGPEDVPDPQSRATFESAVLRWDEIDRGTHAAQLEWYRSLLALRRSHPACGPTTLPLDRQRCGTYGSAVVVQRDGLAVLANLGTTVERIPVPAAGAVSLQRGEVELVDGSWVLGAGATVVLDAD